jgi:hypothetical protein
MKETWYAALDVKTRLVGFDRSASSSRMYFVRLLLRRIADFEFRSFLPKLAAEPNESTQELHQNLHPIE